MKRKFTILTAALLLLTMIHLPGKTVGQTRTAQDLTNANIVAAGAAATGYQDWTIEDDNGNEWYAHAIKNKHSNATSAYHFLQIKKSSESEPSYIQVPELGTQITSITMTVSNTGKPMGEGGNTYNLFFSNSNLTNAIGTGVAYANGASSVTIDCSDLNLNTGYITAQNAVRVWNISVTYISGPEQLSVPANFNATAGNTQATFTWNAVENASSYTISYTPDGGDEAFETGITGTSKTITGLANGTEYTCKIKAVGDGTNYSDSDYSSTKTVTPTNATFYDVNIASAITGGSVTASPVSAIAGATITLTATPSDAYTFNNIASNWTISPAVTVTPGENNTATFEMPASDVSVSATFDAKPTFAITCVADPVAGGTISVSPASAYEGQTVTLSYSANSGYTFSSIAITKTSDGTATGITTTTSFTMPGYAVTVTATFLSENYDGDFLLFTSEIEEGDYIIVYDGGAMNNTISGSRFGITDVTPQENTISNPSNSIVWHIAPSATTGYWTLYNVKEGKYATNGGTNMNIGLDALGENTDWKVTGTTTHEFRNKNNESETARYLRRNTTYGFACYTSSTGGALTLYKHTVLTPVTITFNGHGGATAGSATTYTQNVYSGIEATLNANQFVRSGFEFTNWSTEEGGGGTTYNDGASITISANTTLYAQWAQKYTATVSNSIIGGTVKIDDGGDGVNSINVIAGTEVNLTVTPSTGYAFKAWNVYKADDTETKVTVTNNQFTMPEYNVIISAEFHNKYTITFSVNGNTTVVDPIEVTIGQPADLSGITATMEGFTFAGWSLTESGAVISNTYTPTANVTLYAVFTINTSVNMVINSSTQNFPTSYGSANTFTEYTLNGKRFKIQQGYINGDKLQWRASGNSNGTGTMYNSENFGRITSVVLVYDASDNNKNFTINAGTTENPTSGTSITPSPSGNTYTFDLSDGNYTYFVMTNGSGAGYLSSITIYYTGNATVTFTNITENTNRSTNIPANEVVTVKSGAALTFTGTNNGNETNLIIEDGGQLITGVWVNATVKKNITAYTSADDGWNLISSPVNIDLTAAEIGLTTATTYDLYYLNEKSSKWINFKEHEGNMNPGFYIQPSKGYLYSNAANTTLSFSGSLQPYIEAGYEVNLTKDGEGWNLVGNPFPFNAYVNKPYYVINGRTVEVYEGTDPVSTCTGIIVKATAANEKVTFRRTAFTDGAVNNGNLQMTVTQTVTTRGRNTLETLDNAIVSFNEGNQLEKFYFGTQNANLYIPQGTEEYAIVNAEAQGEMPVNFRANENGQYTLTVNAENVEMNYLHLIDNMTGADIDLLATPSYTFNAKATDYESRFRLVFAANNNASISSATDESFTFYSNGSWVISNEGEATLQVIDALGRILSNEGISGTVSKSINAPAGVYVLRLINGDSVRTQKIVVR